MAIIRKIFEILSPIIYGIALAYLLSPILNFFEKKVFRFKSKKRGVQNLRRILSLICTALVLLALIAATVSIFIPQIIDSYNRLKEGLPGYITAFESFRNNLDGYLEEFFSRNELMANIYESIKEFLGVDENNTVFNQLLNKAATFLVGLFSTDNLSKLFAMGASVISVVVDAVLSVIFTVYVLLSKDKQLARMRKLLTAFCSEATVKEIYRIAYLADEKIGRYLRVQIFDSFLVGVVSYIVYMIFDLPFFPMLALISGVTNIIPYFGPFIGAVPNGIVILLAQPDKLLPFILIVLVIQQLDGNVLVPILQSTNMKMDTLWVLVGMTVMGGIFGLPGMILGVPTFSVIYILIKEHAEKRLVKKNLPTDTAYYTESFRPKKPARKPSGLQKLLTRKQKQGRKNGTQPLFDCENVKTSNEGASTPSDSFSCAHPEDQAVLPTEEKNVGTLQTTEMEQRPDEQKGKESDGEDIQNTGHTSKKVSPASVVKNQGKEQIKPRPKTAVNRKTSKKTKKR